MPIWKVLASRLYPDTLEPIVAPPAVATATVTPDDDTAECTDGASDNCDEPTGPMLCPTCSEEMEERPDFEGMGGWYCDWPGHEGDTYVEGTGYACSTDDCDWAVCPTYWSDIHASKTSSVKVEGKALQQSINTVSRYDAAYYCRVKEVRVVKTEENAANAMLNVSCRGDLSLGAIQDPRSSSLIVDSDGDEERIACSNCSVLSRDAYEVAAILTYVVTDASLLFESKVMFQFGSSGYSRVTKAVPNSSYNDAGTAVPHCANGQPMERSTYSEGGSVNGFICDACSGTMLGERWFCKECSSDLCYDCEPS